MSLSVARAAHRYALLLALALVTTFTAFGIRRASLVVDGTRYYWLDDDMMVSMRYARHLAQGSGLVWNEGERVEGYTSLGWTLVMAAVHLAHLPDAINALVVKILNWILACYVVVLADRLLRRFIAEPGWLRPAVLISVALSYDLLFWSINGFETTLLTVVLLSVIDRLLNPHSSVYAMYVTCVMIGLLPIVRSDAFHLWAGAIVVLLALRSTDRRVWWGVLLAGVLPAIHLIFRLGYYGEWLPNSYYLKVAGISGLWSTGAGYLAGFFSTYVAAWVLALAGLFWSPDRRYVSLLAAMGFSAIYVLMVGEDVMGFFRFLAPWVPVLIVLAAVSCATIADGTNRVRLVLAVVLVAATVTSAGVHDRSGLRRLLSTSNGYPDRGIVTGVLIRDSTSPHATIAVVAAGTVPYFSRRHAVDLLGKTDARVAHLPPHPGALVGHAKFDIDGSLASQPDFIVPLWTEKWWTASQQPINVPARLPEEDYEDAILVSRRFVQEYSDQPLRVPYLLANNMVFVRRDSPERRTIDNWREPVVSR